MVVVAVDGGLRSTVQYVAAGGRLGRKVRSGSWGREGTGVPDLCTSYAAMLRTGYTVPDAHIPCGEPLPSACACLAPTCQCRGLSSKTSETFLRVCVCVHACEVLSVRILVYQTSPSPASAPPPTTDMVRPATLRHGTNPQTPMSWEQGLCPALCLPVRESLQLPRDHRPQAAWCGVDDLADQSRSLLMLGRCRPTSRLKDQSGSRSGSRSRPVRAQAAYNTAYSA